MGKFRSTADCAMILVFSRRLASGYLIKYFLVCFLWPDFYWELRYGPYRLLLELSYSYNDFGRKRVGYFTTSALFDSESNSLMRTSTSPASPRKHKLTLAQIVFITGRYSTPNNQHKYNFVWRNQCRSQWEKCFSDYALDSQLSAIGQSQFLSRHVQHFMIITNHSD